MTINQKTLGSGYLHTSASTHYLAPSNTKGVITNATIANTHSSNAVTAVVHIIPTGASETNANIVIPTRTVAPLESYKCPELIGKGVEATGTIRALASSTSTLTFHIYGYEVN